MKTIITRNRIKRLADFLLNKYVFASLLFLIWLSFFDRYSIGKQWQLSRAISDLETKKEWYEDEILLSKSQIEDLMKRKEKYAREKYYLKKPGEEIYIIQ